MIPLVEDKPPLATIARPLAIFSKTDHPNTLYDEATHGAAPDEPRYPLSHTQAGLGAIPPPGPRHLFEEFLYSRNFLLASQHLLNLLLDGRWEEWAREGTRPLAGVMAPLTAREASSARNLDLGRLNYPLGSKII